jgi:hypothetical protein
MRAFAPGFSQFIHSHSHNQKGQRTEQIHLFIILPESDSTVYSFLARTKKLKIKSQDKNQHAVHRIGKKKLAALSRSMMVSGCPTLSKLWTGRSTKNLRFREEERT